MEYEQLKEHHDALLNENKALKGIIDNERAEKQAVDGLYCDHLKQEVQSRKHIIILENYIKNLQVEKAQLEDQVKRCEDKIKSLEEASTIQENQG